MGLTLPALLTSLGSQIGPGPGQSELPPRVLDDPQEKGIDLGVVAKAFGSHTYHMGLTSSHLIWRCLHVEQPLRLRL